MIREGFVVKRRKACEAAHNVSGRSSDLEVFGYTNGTQQSRGSLGGYPATNGKRKAG